jgi:hypothetical protein
VKPSLAAPALLLLGFALGWLVKPTSEAPVPETNLSSAPGASVLESTSFGNVQSNSPLSPGDTAKDLAALISIFEKDGHSNGYGRAYQHLYGLSTQDLLRLAESLASLGQRHRHYWSAIEAITGRWAELDPESLFAHALTSKDPNVKQRGISQAIKSLAEGDRTRARALLSAINDDELRHQASMLIVQATAKDDPKAALVALQSDTKSRGEYNNLFREWGTAAPQEAAANLDSITTLEDRREAIQGLTQVWGPVDPQAALAWSMSLNNRLERSHATQQILATIQDVRQGATLLANLDLAGRDRLEAINAFASTAIHSDIDSALLWIETLEPRERSNVMASQLSSISQIDPERARQLFDENMTPRLRGVADNLARNLAAKDLPGARAWVESLPPGNIKDRAIQGIVGQLQNADPQSAAAYLDSIDLNSTTSSVADNVARRLFDQDRDAALVWVESKGNSELTRDLLSHWSHQDPAAAAAYAASLEDPSNQQSALQSIMPNWARIDPDEAIAYYNTLKESDRPAVLQNMIGTIANTNIDRAIDFYESNAATLADEDSKHNLAQAADNLVDTWANFDVAAAAEWSATLEIPEARTQAIDEAASAWIRQDSLAASEWIGELPEDPDRDAAVRQLVSHVQMDDPSAAFAWAITLSEEGRRTKFLQGVLSQWKQTDPNAALQALQSADLSNEDYNRLAKQLEE